MDYGFIIYNFLSNTKFYHGCFNIRSWISQCHERLYTSKKITLHMKSSTGLKRVFRFKSTIIKPAASLGIRLKRDYDKSIHNVSIFIENLIVNSHAFIASQNAVTAHGTPDAALFLPERRIFAINGKGCQRL